MFGHHKKKCVIYANCQGRGIEVFLKKHSLFHDAVDIVRLENYIFIKERLQLPIDVFRKADFFIYQPVDPNHGCYATDHLKSYLPEHCRSVSFPYIYNNALWPLFEEAHDIFGQEVILELFGQGYSLKQVVDLFYNEAINFKFEERFKQSLAILKGKEQITDIKVSDFIVRNLPKHKLFLTQAHPTSFVFVYCVNEMLRHFGFSMLSNINFQINEAKLPDCWPLSPYEKNFYGYQYKDQWRDLHCERKDSNWYKFHLKLIGKIYFKNKKILTPKLIFERFFLRIMMEIGLRRSRGYLEE